MALRLNIEEEGKRRAVPLSGVELTIGRGAENGIVIADPRSSRQHCRIVRTPQGLLLEDMSSRNGTLLNGLAVTKSFVKPGDEFRVGNVRFVLEDGTESSRVPVELDDDDEDLVLEDAEEEDAGAPPAPSPASLAETKVGSRTGASPQARKPAAPSAPRRDAADAPRGGLELEALDGPDAGARVAVTRTPFVLGRSRDCELPLEDKRASGKHARILRQGDRYLIEDMGSTNGTLLDRRTVQRAAIGPGSVIQIGNTSFRAIVAGGSQAVAGAVRGGLGEEFVDFDVEKFLARDRSQHPLAVGALLLILGVVGYFTVDVAIRLGRKEDPDPSPAANLIPSNWSFEEASAAPGGPRVQGWKIADGDSGSIEPTEAHAQVPGRRALRLRSTGSQDLCRAAHESDIVLSQERRYRIEGYVLNEGAFAAGLAVEWLRASRGDEAHVERSYSDTARQSGESLDVDQVVTAPAYAAQARVCAFVLGAGGAAVFDRIRLTPVEAAAQASPPAEGAPVEDGAGDGSRRLAIGDEETAFDLVIEDPGTVSLQKPGAPPAASVWCGLDPERDPLGLGPRLAAPRGEPGDGDAFLLIGYVPDVKERKWVQLETAVARDGDDAVLRFRTAEEGDSPPDLSLYIDTREPWMAVPAPGAPSGVGAPSITREIVLGEGAGRISLAFSADLTVEARPNPAQPSRRILRAHCKGHRIKASISAGSRHETSLARAHAERAEEEFRAGRIGAAMDLLSRTKALFPEEAAEVRKAEARLAEWRALAGEALASLEKEVAVLRETPTPVMRRIVAKRAAVLKERFAGTSEAAAAASLLAEVEGSWTSLKSKQTQDELRQYLERARRHLSSGELALAELYFQWVAEADPDGDLGKSARNQIKIIEGRRARDVRILLQ